MVRKTIFRRISVTDEVYQRLKKERDTFQELIGGGRWGISGTIQEFFKIADQNKRGVVHGIGKAKHKKP